MHFYESNRKIIGSKHTKLDTNNNLCHKIEPSEGAVIVMEIDEFWHYLKKKLWIFKRHKRQLIDWEIGDRCSQTFKRLYDRLRKFNVCFY